MTMRGSRLSLICLSLGLLAAPAFAGPYDRPLFPAFHGAEGAGAYTRGGRGGKVLLVTTLDDYDPRTEKPIAGSLRAAVKTVGPRIILFRVAGYIELKTDLDVTDPYLTIAGQSAPGEGVCLKNASLKIQAPEVVIRYLRVRPGDVQRRELDCISCSEQNLILDHCSASWGIDETISTNGNSANVTVGWCLIAESLNSSVHHKGEHGYGSLISGPGEITYHHNVYAFHRSRNPRAGDVLLDFRDNIIYGWGDRAGYSGNDRLRMNYVGNFLYPLAYSKNSGFAFLPGGLSQRIYLENNFHQFSLERTRDNWLMIKPAGGTAPDESIRVLRADHPFPTNTVTDGTARDPYLQILLGAGAVLPARDAIDLRLVNQINQGQGRIINSQADVGGWPPLVTADAAADSDADGMPDEWEIQHCLDPQKSDSASQDTDRDGYPDLEEFLNGTDPRASDAWLTPPAVMSSAGEAFLDATTIRIRADPGAEIHYTLDDSQPTRGSPRYEGPVQLDRTAIVRARSFTASNESHVRNARLLQLALREPLVAKDARPGLRYQYWEGLGTEDFRIVEKTPATKTGIAETISLAPRGSEGDFGFRFGGLFDASADGIYTFTLRCSPRGQLRIGEQEVVESQGRKRERSGKVALKRGLHPLVFDIYYRTAIDKTLQIDFQGPGLTRQPLGPAQLFHAMSDD
jgi:pectate lyase